MTYFSTFWDFVLPGLRCVMAAKRALLEVCTSQPSVVQTNTRTCIHYSVNCVHSGYFKYQNEVFTDRVGGLRDGGQLQPIF